MHDMYIYHSNDLVLCMVFHLMWRWLIIIIISSNMIDILNTKKSPTCKYNRTNSLLISHLFCLNKFKVYCCKYLILTLSTHNNIFKLSMPEVFSRNPWFNRTDNKSSESYFNVYKELSSTPQFIEGDAWFTRVYF